jgi:hypothetical protein
MRLSTVLRRVMLTGHFIMNSTAPQGLSCCSRSFASNIADLNKRSFLLVMCLYDLEDMPKAIDIL